MQSEKRKKKNINSIQFPCSSTSTRDEEEESDVTDESNLYDFTVRV